MGALQVATFFFFFLLLATIFFCAVSGSTSFTYVFQLFLAAGCCYWSADMLLEMLFKFTDFLHDANFHCPWCSCPPGNETLFAIKLKIKGICYLQ